jgi:hypothetical protein
MRTLVSTLACAFGIAACTAPPAACCELSAAELTRARKNVHAYFLGAVGEEGRFYRDLSAVGELVFQDDNGACKVVVSPTNADASGATVLHGEYVVHFEPNSLEPISYSYWGGYLVD